MYKENLDKVYKKVTTLVIIKLMNDSVHSSQDVEKATQDSPQKFIFDTSAAAVSNLQSKVFHAPIQDKKTLFFLLPCFDIASCL
jgi:hypothetical protein